jgi:hypothetical protein
MQLPRMTTRRWLFVVAVGALLLGAVERLRVRQPQRAERPQTVPIEIQSLESAVNRDIPC